MKFNNSKIILAIAISGISSASYALRFECTVSNTKDQYIRYIEMDLKDNKAENYRTARADQEKWEDLQVIKEDRNNLHLKTLDDIFGRRMVLILNKNTGLLTQQLWKLNGVEGKSNEKFKFKKEITGYEYQLQNSTLFACR